MATKSVVLIGMPGSGKSTLGVQLAKRLARSFIDTDLLLQQALGCTLQAYLEEQGHERLRQEEEKVVLHQPLSGGVVATGGSVVYSPAAMAKLKSCGVIVFLDTPVELLSPRLGNYKDRGIASPPGTTLEMLYAERQPLYRQYADLSLDCNGLSQEQLLGAMVACITPENHDYLASKTLLVPSS